jgi:hypothetical protein
VKDLQRRVGRLENDFMAAAGVRVDASFSKIEMHAKKLMALFGSSALTAAITSAASIVAASAASSPSSSPSSTSSSAPSHFRDNTPLALACLKGRLDMASLLISRGADVDQKLSSGKPILLALVDGLPSKAAAGGGSSSNSSSAPPDNNSSSSSSATAPLIYRTTIIQLLLDKGADPHCLSEELPLSEEGSARTSEQPRSRHSLVMRRTAAVAARSSSNALIRRMFQDWEEKKEAVIAGGAAAAAALHYEGS